MVTTPTGPQMYAVNASPGLPVATAKSTCNSCLLWDAYLSYWWLWSRAASRVFAAEIGIIPKIVYHVSLFSTSCLFLNWWDLGLIPRFQINTTTRNDRCALVEMNRNSKDRLCNVSMQDKYKSRSLDQLFFEYWLDYRTRTIITCGLYTFYPLFKVQKRFFKGLFP